MAGFLWTADILVRAEREKEMRVCEARGSEFRLQAADSSWEFRLKGGTPNRGRITWTRLSYDYAN